MVEIGSEEWKEIRRTKISATDLPIIMGVSKWSTPRKLWEQKRSGREPERNYAMSRGIALEPEARACFEEMVGEFVLPKFVVKKWACASFDGINDQGVAVEIKCPLGKADHEYALTKGVPPHYYPQVQWQMYVGDLKEIYYFSYYPNHLDPCAMVKVARDDAYIEECVKKGAEFLHMLQEGILPPACKEDYDVLPTDAEIKEERAAELMSLIKTCEDELEKLREELILYCDGKKREGKFLRFTPTEVKGSVDYGKVPELNGVDLEKYRKKKTIRWRVELI